MMDFRAGNGNEDMKYLMQTHHHHNAAWDPWAQVRGTLTTLLYPPYSPLFQSMPKF